MWKPYSAKVSICLSVCEQLRVYYEVFCFFYQMLFDISVSVRVVIVK